MPSTTQEPQHLASNRIPLQKRPFRLIRENLRTYLIINAGAYGLTLVGLVIGMLFPELNGAQAAALVDDGTAGLVTELIHTPPLFALVILAVNVFRLSLLTIVVPSLVAPFAGLAFFAYWAVETGITLAPVTPQSAVAMIPHSLTIIIELQAYILLLLGSFLLGRSWVAPGAGTRRQGYVRGLRHLGLLALPALALLVVGAIWEAYSLRYLVHPLSQWLL